MACCMLRTDLSGSEPSLKTSPERVKSAPMSGRTARLFRTQTPTPRSSNGLFPIETRFLNSTLCNVCSRHLRSISINYMYFHHHHYTMRALASDAVYCNRSSLFVCVFVALLVRYHDKSKLRTSIFTKLGL